MKICLDLWGFSKFFSAVPKIENTILMDEEQF